MSYYLFMVTSYIKYVISLVHGYQLHKYVISLVRGYQLHKYVISLVHGYQLQTYVTLLARGYQLHKYNVIINWLINVEFLRLKCLHICQNVYLVSILFQNFHRNSLYRVFINFIVVYKKNPNEPQIKRCSHTPHLVWYSETAYLITLVRKKNLLNVLSAWQYYPQNI